MIKYIHLGDCITPVSFSTDIALASEEGGISNANTAWILTSTALVLFMTLPGLAFLWRTCQK